MLAGDISSYNINLIATCKKEAGGNLEKGIFSITVSICQFGYCWQNKSLQYLMLVVRKWRDHKKRG